MVHYRHRDRPNRWEADVARIVVDVMLKPEIHDPQGEAIAYSPDGKSFLTLSDEPVQTTLRKRTPSTTIETAAVSAE